MAEKRAKKSEPKSERGPKREQRTAENAGGGARIDARSPKSLGKGQWALCLVSVLIAVTGGGLWVYSAMAGDHADRAPASERGSQAESDSNAGDLVSGFTGDSQQPGGVPKSGDGEPTDSAGDAAAGEWLDTWSPSIFRLGFSFFVGFTIGYALRAFVKMTLILIGTGFLAMFLLQYAGLVDVNWGLLEGHYDETIAWLKREGSSFTEFAKGYLPSGASAVAGLVIGFRRKR